MTAQDEIDAALVEAASRIKSSLARISALEAFMPGVPIIQPRPNWWKLPDGILGITPNATVWKNARITPWPIGPQTYPIDNYRINVTTAYTGMSSDAQFICGFVPDDGTSFPDFSKGVFGKASTNLSNLANTGAVNLAPASPYVPPKPGFYWMATLITGTTAPTAGALSCITNNVYQLGSGGGAFGPVRGYTLTNLNDLPSTQPLSTSFSVSGSNDCPAVMIHRASS